MTVSPWKLCCTNIKWKYSDMNDVMSHLKWTLCFYPVFKILTCAHYWQSIHLVEGGQIEEEEEEEITWEMMLLNVWNELISTWKWMISSFSLWTHLGIKWYRLGNQESTLEQIRECRIELKHILFIVLSLYSEIPEAAHFKKALTCKAR